MYWYNPCIINFPFSSVIYVPSSFSPLYNLNFASFKYVVTSCWVPFSPSVIDITFFIFVISKSYVGIFSSSNSRFIVGILSSSVIVEAFAVPSETFTVYVPFVFVTVNLIVFAK